MKGTRELKMIAASDLHRLGERSVELMILSYMEVSVIVGLQRPKDTIVEDQVMQVQRVAEKAAIKAVVVMKSVDVDGLSRNSAEGDAKL